MGLPQTAASAPSHFDGVEFEVNLPSESMEEPEVNVTLSLKTGSTMRYKLDPKLSNLLDLVGVSECSTEVFSRLWSYIRSKKLMTRGGGSNLSLDPPLQELLQAETVPVYELGERLLKSGALSSPTPLSISFPLSRKIAAAETSFVIPSPPILDMSPHPLVNITDERIGSLVRAIQETGLKRKFLSAFSKDPVGVSEDALVSVVSDARVAWLDPDIAASLELATSESAWRTSAPVKALQGTARFDESLRELVALGDLAAELERQNKLKEELKAAVEEPIKRVETIKEKLRDPNLVSRRHITRSHHDL